MVFVGTPVCIGCRKKPIELDEYIEAAEDFQQDVNLYVREGEGTYNDSNGHFLCTDCYVRAGAPSTPNGWVAP